MTPNLPPAEANERLITYQVIISFEQQCISIPTLKRRCLDIIHDCNAVEIVFKTWFLLLLRDSGASLDTVIIMGHE